MDADGKSAALIVPANHAQKIRHELEKLHMLDETHKFKRLECGQVALPLDMEKGDVSAIQKRWPDLLISKVPLPMSKKMVVRHSNPAAQLHDGVRTLLKQHNISECLMNEVPSKWERHGDLAIIPASAFASSEWKVIGDLLWQVVTKALACARLACHSTVADNGFRSSQVVMLYGEDGIVTHVDNGIRYSYDVTKCMFSAGNITEKLRIASFDCTGETIVDLYAGIGYFTLPYLVHTKAHHVHACEWNPDAVAALKNNLLVNGVSDKCTVHEGDNRLLQLTTVADRVNLGLIPSSEEGWPVAVQVLKQNGGILHIHGNVTTTLHQRQSLNENNVNSSSDLDMEGSAIENTCSETGYSGVKIFGGSEKEKMTEACKDWSHYVRDKIKSLLSEVKGGMWSVTEMHIEVVKSYAPHVFHVVLDLDCRMTVSERGRE